MKFSMRACSILAVATCAIAGFLYLPSCSSTDYAATRAAAVDRQQQAIDQAKNAQDAVDAAKKLVADLTAQKIQLTTDLATTKSSLADVKASRDQLAAAVGTLQEQSAERKTADAKLAEFDSRLGSLNASVSNLSTSTAAIDAKVAAANAAAVTAAPVVQSATAKAEAIGANIAKADAQAKDAGGPLPGLLGLISSLIPGAASAVAVLSPFLVELRRKTIAVETLKADLDEKTSATSNVVKSIDVLASLAPEVAAALSKHKSTIDRIQGASGKALVDEHQPLAA